MKIVEEKYPGRLLKSLHNLISAKEILTLGNLRRDYLHYFFAFPLAMIFVNVQDFFLYEGVSMFGLSHTTITFIAFIGGAIILFAATNEANIYMVSKIAALMSVTGLVPWLMLPSGQASLIFSIIMMAGIGGCVSVSSFSYVFMLNNAERFYGSALMVLLIGAIGWADGYILILPLVRKVMAFILAASLSACIFISKKEDYNCGREGSEKKFKPSVWLVLYIFLAYFTIRITGFYAAAFGHPSGAQLWGLLAIILILCCVIMQMAFKRSVWTLCNVFFLSSVAAHVMWYMKLPQAAYLFSEFKEVGLLISLYLVGCVTNKFCSFKMHKLLIIISMTACGMLYTGIDLLHLIMDTQTLAVVTASALFIFFLLLSPAFSQHLFFADWSREFRMIHMSVPGEESSKEGEPQHKVLRSLDDTNLSPREKQVVLLLLRGMTLRQAAPELGLTFSTVSTYSKTIYKKLGINSRAELFLLFGYTHTDKEEKIT